MSKNTFTVMCFPTPKKNGVVLSEHEPIYEIQRNEYDNVNSVTTRY